MTTQLFVYGTLKNGKSRIAYVHGDLYNVGRFPGVLNAGISQSWVKGEIHEVPKTKLPGLDRYEGVPFLYIRKKIEVYDENKVLLDFKVWIYQFNEPLPETNRCGEEWTRQR